MSEDDMGKLMVVVGRFFFLCAAVLVLPPIVASQPISHTPGWYSNSGAGGDPSVIYEDSTRGFRVVWENSYIYQYPGDSALYWYVQVKYINFGNQTLPISCDGWADPSLVKEHMRGTANAGYVPASETFCSRNPNFTGSLEPGGVAYDWAIFHNVPWPGGEVSLEWGTDGFSGWVDPWYYRHPSDSSPPTECPDELVALGTCQPGGTPNVPHPGAYEIAQKISEVWQLIPNDPPASLTDGVIAVACFAGTLKVGLPVGIFKFEIPCVTKLKEIEEQQRDRGTALYPR